MSGLIKYDQGNDEEYNYALQHLALKLLYPTLPYDEAYEILGDKRLCELFKSSAVSSIYSVSNERLRELFEHFNMEGKSILTTGSSFDQVIFAILKGVKKAIVADANPMSLPFGELKMAGIKNLEFEEFEKLFCSEGFLDYQFYSKLSHDLSEQARVFWETLLLESSGVGNGFDAGLIRVMFQQYGYISQPFSVDEKVRNYKDREQAKTAFYKAKKALDSCEIGFVFAELSEFAKKVDGTFDFVFLSNIGDYVDKTDFCEVVYALGTKLNKGGFVQIHSAFNRIYCGADYNLINRLASFNKDEKLAEINRFYDSRKPGAPFDIGGVKRISLSENEESWFNSPNSTIVTKEYLDSTKKNIDPKSMERISALLKKSELEFGDEI